MHDVCLAKKYTPFDQRYWTSILSETEAGEVLRQDDNNNDGRRQHQTSAAVGIALRWVRFTSSLHLPNDEGGADTRHREQPDGRHEAGHNDGDASQGKRVP